ncbi:zinc finger, CCHC-type containing protein [Tanacetum coccineum]
MATVNGGQRRSTAADHRQTTAGPPEEGQSVSSYVLKIKRYIDNLERLGQPVSLESYLSLSLSKEYDGFVQNYNMHSMGKTVNELHAMLKLHEQTLPKKDVAPALHAIRARRAKQRWAMHLLPVRGRRVFGAVKRGRGNPVANTPKKDNTAKDAICHQCGEADHWRRNCPVYLAELLKKKKLSQGASTSGIFTIELYSFPSKSWVYDICITTQGLRGSRKLKPRALSLYVGDGHREAVEVIREFHLCFPSGLVLILHNCHYAPSITRGIILVSRLYNDGFVNRFDGNVLSVSRNNLGYFSAIPRDGIY